MPPRGKKSKRWLWITLSAVLAVVLLCTGGAFALRSHFQEQNAERAANYDEKHNPIKREEIDALLAGQTKALKDRDEKAFLAPFDPANKKLVDQQRALFRNLVKLPFAEARFEARRKEEFKSFGAGVSVEQMVSFVHKLDGYDLHPVDEQYWWTLVRTEKGAPVKVTAAKGIAPRRDDDVTYYPAPWDKWRNIHVERTEHALLIVDASFEAQAQRYAPEAERAAAANLAAWRTAGVPGEIPQGFVISLVRGKKDLGSLYRTSKKPPPEAGVSFGIPRYQDPDAPEDKTSPLIGGSRVVIDLATPFFRPSDPGGPGEIFRHELAHSMVASLTARTEETQFFFRQAAWVVEGFAEYLGNERKSWTASARAGSGAQALRSGRYAAALPEQIDLGNAVKANLDYWMGHAGIGYLAEKYGERKAFEVVAEHYRGKELKDVMPKVLGVSYDDFQDACTAYVLAKVR